MMKHPAVGLAHIGWPCNDYKKTVEFYKNIGFVEDVVKSDMGGFWRCGDCVIEIWQHGGPPKPTEAGPINHIALRSEDIDASFAEAQEMGLEIVSEGIESNEMYAPKTNRYFIFLGPDGERIEFAQVK